MVAMLLSSTVFAQQTYLDSLYAIWKDKSQPDSNRVRAYSDYIWDGFLFSQPDTAEVLADALLAFALQHQYPKASSAGYTLKATANSIQGNYQRALAFNQKSLEIYEELGYKIGIATSLINIGIAYKEQGNYPRALEHYQKALAISDGLGDKLGISNSANNIGTVYDIMGNYPRALEYYQKSLVMTAELGDEQGTSYTLSNIGTIYQVQGNYPRALEYYQNSLAILEKIGDQIGISTNLSNIGVTYQYLSDYPRSLEYHQKSLTIREELGDKQGISGSLNNIGTIYTFQGNNPRALEYFQKSLSIKEEIGDTEGIAGNLTNIGTIYKEQGKHGLALDYCLKALAVAEEIGVLSRQRSACQCLYETYKTKGMGNEALMYHEKMVMLRDSMFNEENTKKLTRLEMQYEFDRKEAATLAEQDKKDAIAAQELQRQKLARNGFMGGFAVVLLFAGVFLVQRNRLGREKQRSEELLHNILPEEVAEELKEKGHSDAQLIDHVTVLFTDFKGFTALSEKVTPKELVKDLHDCFSLFDQICEKHGIEKIKTIGDAYMAAGGLPVPNSTHAHDVVKAALEMAEVVEQGKARKINAGLPYFEVRIGIHTGPVVAGIVGLKKFQYDIWGDTVNTASRMESSGEVGKVNISESTYALVRDDIRFTFESRGKVAAKGKGELKMYFVTQA